MSASHENSPKPRLAISLERLLQSMGEERHEPQVISMLMEIAHRYTTELLEDADAYKRHTKQTDISEQDIALAQQVHREMKHRAPPPREALAEIAERVNSLPLPAIPTRSGLLLPPERYCLTQGNYQVKAADPEPES